MLHVYDSTMVVHVSICSGALVRRVDDVYLDNVLAHDTDVRDSYSLRRRSLPSIGYDLDTCFSTHFSMVPYVKRDRPPRTLLSSVNATQCSCYPYVHKSIMMTPANIHKCFVTTPLIDDLIQAGAEHYIPGENLVVLFANLPDNYEDCIIANRASVERGMLSYYSITSVALDPGTPYPPQGQPVDRASHRWWTLPLRGTVSAMEQTVQFGGSAFRKVELNLGSIVKKMVM